VATTAPVARYATTAPVARYSAVAIVLHWLIALGIIALLAMGLVMTQVKLTPAVLFPLYQLHKSIGITVLFLVLLRVIWRLTHRPPPLPATMPAPERAASSVVHLLLYGLMLYMPLTGWAVASASPLNIPTVLYGLVPWPHLPILSGLTNKKPVEAVLETVHAWGAWVVIAVVALHIAAALRHHLITRDDILLRMLPRLGKTQ
jgi:cytochrome b561